MFLLDWYKQYLDIRTEFKQKKLELNTVVKKEETVCQSCETLRVQLEIANYEKKQLLDRILEKPEAPPITEPPAITRPKMVPWNVRRQILEQEDREKARALRNAATPDAAKVDVTELEKELNVAGQEREAQAADSRGTQ